MIAGLGSFNEVLARATNVGSTTVINLDGGHSVTFLDMQKSALQAS